MATLPTDVIARIDRLELDARQVVEGYLSGRHKSPQHGFAVEFAEHREYAPGDDIKHVDWKVYGRTERYHLKQYEQETNLVAWMVVDASESMAFRSGDRSKYDVACRTAAALAFVLLQQTDAVGLATISDRVRHFLRPSARGGNHFREFLKLLVEPPSSGPTSRSAANAANSTNSTNPNRGGVRSVAAPNDAATSAPAANSFGQTLDELAARLGRRGIVFIFSDLLDDVEPFLAGLRHLQFQKHEVVVFQVLDAAELDFPFRHPTLFRGLEGLPELSTDPLTVRESYLAELGRHLAALDEGCRRLEIDLIRLRTDADLGHELAVYLRKRAGQ